MKSLFFIIALIVVTVVNKSSDFVAKVQLGLCHLSHLCRLQKSARRELQYLGLKTCKTGKTLNIGSI